MSEFAGLLNHLRTRFDTEHIRFVIGGSFALAAHGYPRATNDVDIMVLTRHEDLTPVHRALSAPRYSLINEVTFQDEKTGLFLDLIPVVDEAQRAVFETAKVADIKGTQGIPVLTAEGLSLMLLREATQGDLMRRGRRLLDLESLASGPALDWPFLLTWARRMGYLEAYREWNAAGKPEA